MFMKKLTETSPQPIRPFTPPAVPQQPSGYDFTLSKNSSQEQLQQRTSVPGGGQDDYVMEAARNENRFVPLDFKRDKVQRVVERALSRQRDDQQQAQRTENSKLINQVYQEQKYQSKANKLNQNQQLKDNNQKDKIKFMHWHDQDHGEQEPYNVQDQFYQGQEEDGYPDYQREQVEKLKARRARNSKIQQQDGSRDREFSDSQSPRQYERPNKFQAPWHTEEAPNGAPVIAPQSRLGREYFQQQQSFTNNNKNQDGYDVEDEEYQEPQLHSLNIRDEHDQYQPPYLQQKAPITNANQAESMRKFQQSVQVKQNADGSAVYPGQRPGFAQSNVRTGQASGYFAEPKQNEAVKNDFDQNNQNQLDGPNQNLRKSPDDEIDPFESEPENDSAEFDEGPIIGSQTPIKPLESKAFSENMPLQQNRSMVKNPQNLHNKVMKRSRISPRRQVISIKTDKLQAPNQQDQSTQQQHISFVPNAWAHNQPPPSSSSKLQPKEQNWQSIQEQIDYDYQRKLKQVSDEAMQKLRQFQSEHREQIAKNKMEYDQRVSSRQVGAPRDTNQPLGRIRGRRDSSQPRNVFSSQGFSVPNDRNRFFSPQNRIGSQQTFEMQVQPPQNRNEYQEFKQQYDAIIDSDREIMLVDILDKIKMLRDQRNDQESQESLYNFLKGSNKNMIIKSEYTENENGQDISTNLFILLCAIQNYEVPHEYDLPVFDEKLLVSYINNINFDRDDADLIVIDQVIAIRSIINRPAFVLSNDQEKLISAKFRNMAENRLRSSPYQTPTRFQQMSEDDEFKSYPRLMTPPPRNHGHQQIYETDNEQSRNLEQKSNEKVNDEHQKQIEQYRPATPMIASHVGYTPKLQNRNILNPDIVKQQELDQQLLGEPDPPELKKPKAQPKMLPQSGLKLRPDQIEELHQAFRAIDIDQSGLVTKRELIIMLKGQLQLDQINELIQKVDQNKDGFISFSEFLNAASSGELDQVLHRIDTAQAEHLPDGRIARGSTRQSQQAPVPQQQFRFQQSRQTGRNQPLQEDAYEDHPKAQPAKQHRVPINQMNSPSNILSQEQINELKIAFRQFDKNNDGVLNKREVRNMLRPLDNEIDPADVDKIIEKADINKDGVISYKEFMNAITNGIFTGNPPRPKERKQQYAPKPPQQMMRKEPERKQLKTPERRAVRPPEKAQFKTEAKPRVRPAPPIKTLNSTLAQKYQLTPEQIKTLRLQFMKADIDKNGTLTKREMNVFLRRQAIYIPEQQLQQLMDDIDDDGNGEISLEEFIAACSGVKPVNSASPARDNAKEPKSKKVQKSNSRPAPPRLDHKGYSTDTFKRDKGYQPDQTNDKILVSNHRQQPSNAKLTTQNSSETDLNQPERQQEPHLTKEQLQELQQVFQEVDADQDGVLTKKELRFFLKNLKGGPKLSNQAFNSIIEEADVNKDGLIDFNEFIQSQLGSKIVKMEKEAKKDSDEKRKLQQQNQTRNDTRRKLPFENYLETKEQRKKLGEMGKNKGPGARQHEEDEGAALRGRTGSLVFHEQQKRTEAVHGKNVKKKLGEARQGEEEQKNTQNNQLIGHLFNHEDQEQKQEIDFEPNDTYQNYMDQKSLDAEETLNEYAQEKPQALNSSDPDHQKELQVIRAKSVTRSQRSQASKAGGNTTKGRKMMIPQNAYRKGQEREPTAQEDEPEHIMEIDLDGDIIKIYPGEKPYDIVERLKVKYNLSERSELRLFEQIMNEFQNNQ